MNRNPQRIYTGRRSPQGRAPIVHVINKDGDSRLLGLHLTECNHSPTGFEWGYSGSGPAQLAFEILFDVFGDAVVASRLHQDFKRQRIATLNRERPWKINEDEVIVWAAKHLGATPL